MWTPDTLHEKRLRADWEQEVLVSRISMNAPVVCFFGHDDENVLTFACSDAVHPITLKAVIREEDSFAYCHVTLFPDDRQPATNYTTKLRIDCRPKPFYTTLKNTAVWWEAPYVPLNVPNSATDPVYSTWYSYHQSITEAQLLEECRASAAMGYKTIIVDDGWQTLDSNRGYDYTGDWEPDRIQDMAGFVRDVHNTGMKCMVWYSVPFVGVKSKAFQEFKDKCLTLGHRWAPVFDPRFPEVRAYLVNKYATALKDWNLDGFKLDFIDDFKLYEDAESAAIHGRDFASVEAAVAQLMSDVIEALTAIKPDILIEFRQRYIGPAMRQYGNMFRAFDCPNDSITNRIRTTDVKLLCGNSAVHADMVTWHYDEPVEIAALQLLNVLFSVPQLSVRLAEIPADHRQMIETFTQYWIENRDLLLFGDFCAHQPLANYPILETSNSTKHIVALYQDMICRLNRSVHAIDIVNAKRSERMVLDIGVEMGDFEATVFDCIGQRVAHSHQALTKGLHPFDVPASGRLELRRSQD